MMTTEPATVQRLYKYAYACVAHYFKKRGDDFIPTLLIDRPDDSANPYTWAMSKAGPGNDPVTGKIPDKTRHTFKRIGNMLCMALQSQAVVFVSEVYVLAEKGHKGETKEEAFERAHEINKETLARNPATEERLLMAFEWIENGKSKKRLIMWRLDRERGHKVIGNLDEQYSNGQTDTSGFFTDDWLPSLPVPDDMAKTLRTGFAQFGVQL